jgi:hypothetical protein
VIANEVEPTHNMPVVVTGNLNVDMYGQGEQSLRDLEISTTMAGIGLHEWGQHFYQCRKHRFGYNWQQQHERQQVMGQKTTTSYCVTIQGGLRTIR